MGVITNKENLNIISHTDNITIINTFSEILNEAHMLVGSVESIHETQQPTLVSTLNKAIDVLREVRS
jgi:hypothetical protein